MSKSSLRSDSNPSISIVLATLGKDLNSLRRCLENLKEQTFKNFEIIVVHPYKPEGELVNICKFYNAILVEENSKSLGAARNTGVQYARGSLITFTDDDCEFPQTWLEKIYCTFQQHRDISCLGGPDLTPPSAKNNIFRVTIGTFAESRRQKFAFDRSAINKIKGANVTYPKRIFKEVGYLNTSLHACGDCFCVRASKGRSANPVSQDA